MGRNRISEALSIIFGNKPKADDSGRLRFELTARGYAMAQRYLAQNKASIAAAKPIQQMAQTEGWKIIDKELSDEVLALWTGALKLMASPDAKDREQAMWDCLIAETINTRLLKRINGAAVHVTMVEWTVESLENAKNDYASLTGANGNG